jgi:hypothetical protein
MFLKELRKHVRSYFVFGEIALGEVAVCGIAQSRKTRCSPM